VQHAAPVSTIIPAYNAERYLAETLASVSERTLAPRQIIVVDDGSTDRTAAIARGVARIFVMRTEHAGLGAALNTGLAAAEEEFIAFVDADDLWLPEKLEKQVPLLRRPNAPDMLFAHVTNFLSPDISDDLRRRIQCPAAPQPGYCTGTMVARRRVLDRVGDFDAQLRVGQFIDWYNRAVELGLTHEMLGDVLLRRRLHGGNISWRADAARGDFARVAKAALDRRRRRV
jgi:glycosyltransferase involved in cell wall biosynthesis